MERKNKILFFLILFLALFLRIYKLDKLELFGDELDVGYHAYSLLRTGRDYYGQNLPFYIHSFSEWRAPLLMYVTVPFLAIFGLNEWGVRLPSVFFGMLNIVLFFGLVKILFRSEKIALASSFLIAFTPWHIHYSRAAFETTLLLFLLLLGTVFFLKKRWVLTSVFFALSFYTYNVANVFVPLWLFFLFLIFRVNIKNVLRYLIIFGFFILPIILLILDGRASGRFKMISIFSNQENVAEIIFKRNTGISSGLERFFHNKLISWTEAFWENYLTAFSLQFLFLNGDPLPRHNQPGWGEFYWVWVVFLILGIWDLLKMREDLPKRFVLGWLIIAPIPSALTIGGGNQATRLFLMIPPIVILISLGFLKLTKGSFLRLIATIFLVLFFSFFWLHDYFVHYPKEQFRYWHYGYKEAFIWLKNNKFFSKRVFINNDYEPALLRYLFWTEYSPADFHKKFKGDVSLENILEEFDGFLFENVYFGGLSNPDAISWFTKNLAKDDLYLAFQGKEVPGDWNWEKEPPLGLRVLKTVYDPWGKPLMYWITKN